MIGTIVFLIFLLIVLAASGLTMLYILVKVYQLLEPGWRKVSDFYWELRRRK
jgi:hypothetical protein